MIYKQVTTGDTKNFCKLIVDMYSHLNNLEWFTPMPYDEDNVKGMIENSRFYILGAYEDNKLVAVSALDYKCGKLIGKFDFPTECTLDNTVELAFNIVHSKYRGRGIMKTMLSILLEKVDKDGYTWVFSKVHIDNLASLKSILKNGLEVFKPYAKSVDKSDFISLSSQEFFSTEGKANAKITLSKFKDSEDIIVNYNILIKKLK